MKKRSSADQHDVPFDATIERARAVVADHFGKWHTPKRGDAEGARPE
jgi:hypothetical protein